MDTGGTNIKYGLIDEAENLIESHELKRGPGILGKTKALVESTSKKIPSSESVFRHWMVNPIWEIFYAGPQIPNMQETQFKKETKRPIISPAKLKMMSTVLV